MSTRLRAVFGWVPAILVAAMNVFALYGKFVPPAPGTPGDLFATQVGMKGLELPLGILELIVVTLFLIPRTSTVGLVLMVGYMGGVLATLLTHGFSVAESGFIIVLLLLLGISAWFRNPELTDRLLGKPRVQAA